MTTSTGTGTREAHATTPQPSPTRRVRPRTVYWDFRTARWEQSPAALVPVPREGER